MEIDKTEDEVQRMLRELENSKPLYASNEEALKAFTHQLEQLAAKYNQTVDEFIKEAEVCPIYNEDHSEGLWLSSKIYRLESLI